MLSPPLVSDYIHVCMHRESVCCVHFTTSRHPPRYLAGCWGWCHSAQPLSSGLVRQRVQQSGWFSIDTAQTGQASSRDHWPQSAPYAHSDTHAHTITYALSLYLLVDLQQNPRGGQSSACMVSLHADNADGRSLCTSCFVHPGGARCPHSSADLYNQLTCRPGISPLSSSHYLQPCSHTSVVISYPTYLSRHPPLSTVWYLLILIYRLLLVSPADWRTFSPQKQIRTPRGKKTTNTTQIWTVCWVGQ